MKHKIAGKYTALEAAQLLEAEGIRVPETLMAEIEDQRGKGDEDDEPTPVAITINVVDARADDGDQSDT
jgi:hypothetical protein